MANPRVVAMLKRRPWKIVEVEGVLYVVPKAWTMVEFNISEQRMKEYNLI